MRRPVDGRDHDGEARRRRGGGRGRGPRPLARGRRTAGAGRWRRSRRTAPSCSAASTSTTRLRSRSASASAGSRCSVEAIRRRSSGSPSTPTKNPSAAYLRGPSTGTSTAAPTTSRSWPRSSAPMRSPTHGGETEFASTYAAYEDLSDEDKELVPVAPGGAHVRGLAATRERRPVARGAGHVAVASGQGAPAGVEPPVRAALAGARCHRRPRRRHGPRRGTGPAQRPARTVDEPERVYRHEWKVGDMVIWDNRGSCTGPAVPATSPRDMHRTTLAGDEAIQ